MKGMKQLTKKIAKNDPQKVLRLSLSWLGVISKAVQKERLQCKCEKRPFEPKPILLLCAKVRKDLLRLKEYGAEKYDL